MKVISKGRIERECRFCGKTFTQPACRAKRDHYCSASCGKEHRLQKKEMRKSQCIVCEKEFYPRSSMTGKFCSLACYRKANRGENHYLFGKSPPQCAIKKQIDTKRRNGSIKSGPENPTWMPEIIVAGYVFIDVDGKKVPEHRHVMECYLGRKLLPSEIVHHIDEDGLNNDISNLQVMTRAEHIKIHGPKMSKERGEKHRSSKLTRDDVLAIRAKLKAGRGPVEIAREYCVSPPSISAIRDKKTWAWLK